MTQIICKAGDHEEVYIDGIRIRPTRSLKLRNHSPTGFSWGYEGSGPAQLALAILLEVTNDAELSQRHYQQFKREVVGQWPFDGDVTVEIDIHEWVRDAEGYSRKAV